MTHAKPDHLDKTEILYGVLIDADGVHFDKPFYYQCPECSGPVTHYGGGLWLCGSCDYQW